MTEDIMPGSGTPEAVVALKAKSSQIWSKKEIKVPKARPRSIPLLF